MGMILLYEEAVILNPVRLALHRYMVQNYNLDIYSKQLYYSTIFFTICPKQMNANLTDLCCV